MVASQRMWSEQQCTRVARCNSTTISQHNVAQSTRRGACKRTRTIKRAPRTRRETHCRSEAERCSKHGGEMPWRGAQLRRQRGGGERPFVLPLCQRTRQAQSRRPTPTRTQCTHPVSRKTSTQTHPHTPLSSPMIPGWAVSIGSGGEGGNRSRRPGADRSTTTKGRAGKWCHVTTEGRPDHDSLRLLAAPNGFFRVT